MEQMSYWQTRTEGAIFEAFDKLLADSGVTEKIINFLETRTPPELASQSSEDSFLEAKLDEIAGDLLKERFDKEGRNEDYLADNLFTLTLKEEYSQVNPDFSELIDILYLRKKYMTVDDYKHLNEVVYNLVMDTYNSNKVRHVGIYKEIKEGVSSQPITWAEISNEKGYMDYTGSYYFNRDFRESNKLVKDNKPLYVDMPEHDFYLNDVNNNRVLYQVSSIIDNFAETVTAWIKEYNRTEEGSQDKIDEEMMIQLIGITPESDTLKWKALPKQTAAFADKVYSTISTFHKDIFLRWINTTVQYYYPPIESYDIDEKGSGFVINLNTDLPVIEDESPSPLLEEFLSRHFKKETALEDLLRIMLFSCPGNRPNETYGTKCQDIERCILEGKGSAESVGWLIQVLITPMMDSSMGTGTSTLAKVDAGEFSPALKIARQMTAASRGKNVIAKALPSLAVVASGETLARDLGRLGVKEIIEFIKHHPVYEFIKQHENDDAADIVSTAQPIQSPEVIYLPDCLSHLKGDLHPTFLSVMKFYVQLSRFTAALSAVFSIIAHKLIAAESNKEDEIVYGLSSSLIHAVYHTGNQHIAMPLDWFADINGKVLSYAPITIGSLPGEYTDELLDCVKFFNEKENKKHKRMLLLQDKPSPIITSHAPTACIKIEAAERLQQFFATLRAGLKEKYYIIANSMPIPHNELMACLKGENKISFLPNAIKTNKVARALNKKLQRTNWTPNFDENYLCVYHNRPDLYASEASSTPSGIYKGWDSYSAGAYSYLAPDDIRGNFLVEDCPVISGTRLLDICDNHRLDTNSYERRICRVFNDWNSVGVVGKHKYVKVMDSGIAYGHGEAVFNTVFHTVWHMKLLNAIAKTPRPSTAKICGMVVIPEISTEYKSTEPERCTAVPRRLAVNSPSVAGIRVEYYKRLKAEKCSISDLVKPAYGRMSIITKSAFDMRHLDRVDVSRLNWQSVYNFRVRNPNLSAWNQEGRNFIRASEGGNDSGGLGCSVSEFSEVSLTSVYRSFMPLAYTDNINDEFICFFSIWDYIHEKVKTSEYIEVYRRLFPMAEFLKGAANIPDEIVKEIKIENNAKIPMDFQLNKNEKSFHLDKTNGKAALELISTYNDFVIKDYKDGKLKKAQDELTRCQHEVELWQEKIFQAKEKISEIEEEIEEIKHKGSAAGLDDPMSMQSQLNTLIQEGQILDYKIDKSSHQVIFITKPINLWVCGYIYTLSSAIIKIPLNISQFRLNNDGRATVYALKDLSSMRAEAFALFGAKYGIKSYKEFNQNLEYIGLSHTSNDESSPRDFPHVYGGSGCLGYGVAAARIKSAISQGDLSSFLSGMLMYLNSVTINDAWGRTIRYWPAVPATMFNLIKCGLLTDMDLDRHQMILVPGKYLSYQNNVGLTNWYNSITNGGATKSGAAYVRIYDMDPSILKYLYDEARYLVDKGYNNDFDYIKSFDQDNSDHVTFAGGFESIFLNGDIRISDIQSMMFQENASNRNKLVRSGNVLMEYAYNILTSDNQAAQERCWDFLERSILDISKWRENIRVAGSNYSLPQSDFKICLDGNTVIVKGE